MQAWEAEQMIQKKEVRMKRLIVALCLFIVAVVVGKPCLQPDCIACNHIEYATDGVFAHTHWTPRPAGQQYFVYGGFATQDKINLPYKNEWYGIADLTVSYEQTMQRGTTSSYFAKANGFIVIGQGSGSKMVNAISDNPTGTPVNEIQYSYTSNGPVDIRASDLGLSTTGFSTTFCFQPKIQNFVAQLDAWFGFDNAAPGLFARMRLPLSWSRWNMQMARTQATIPDPLYFLVQGFDGPITYTLTPPPIRPEDGFFPLNDALEALSGTNIAEGIPIGNLPRLVFGAYCGVQETTGIADIPVDIGYNPFITERARIGASLHVVFPAGTRNDNRCLFYPRIGLGRWQIGIDAGAQYTFINYDSLCLTWYTELITTVLLPTREERLLGLKSNNTYAFNHYLLLKEFDALAQSVTLQRAANLLFQPLQLKASYNIDFSTWLAIRHGGAQVYIAYQLLARGAERMRHTTTEKFIPVEGATFGNPNNYYVIKGDTPEYLPVIAAGPSFAGINLVSPHCYSKADSDISTLGALIPTGATFPAQNQAPANAATLTQIASASFTAADVIADPALHPRYLSQAFALAADYEFTGELMPFVGGGFQLEFGANQAAMNMWTIFAKGGVQF